MDYHRWRPLFQRIDQHDHPHREVGELARIMARRYGDQSEKESDRKANLADEMADILWVLAALANQTGVDLSEAFQANIEKKTRRDADRHRNNPTLQ